MAGEVYPTILAGQKITTTLLESMQTVYAIKTASTSRASTTTVTADPELQFTVVAGAEYVGEFYFRISGDAAADMDVQFTTPAGATGSWGSTGQLAGTSATDADTRTSIRRALNAEIQQSTPTTGTAQINEGHFRITMGGTGGTFSIDWAQTVSNATATVMEADSWVSLTRVA